MLGLPAVFTRLPRLLLVAAGCVIGCAAGPLAYADEPELLDESEYRTELEEVIVVGKEPEWRRERKGEWRPDRFELPTPTQKSRIEWFPRYTKDERDNYDGVRDRTGEKPEFKIFEWKF